VLEVAQVGAVGAAHLAQLRSRGGHDLGQPEGATDLDQLPARHHHLAVAGEGGQDQEECGGVVVHHHRRLGAADARDPAA
jgi:hypothetical protein